MLAEVGETDKLLTSRVASDKLYFRPPFGDWNDAVMNVGVAEILERWGAEEDVIRVGLFHSLQRRPTGCDREGIPYFQSLAKIFPSNASP